MMKGACQSLIYGLPLSNQRRTHKLQLFAAIVAAKHCFHFLLAYIFAVHKLITSLLLITETIGTEGNEEKVHHMLKLAFSFQICLFDF